MIHSTEIEIIHSDPMLVVVNKPGGLLAVPGRGVDKQDCVVRRLQAEFPEMIDQPSVHRLDMYTSGLMVVARTREAHRNLCRQFELRQVDKMYTAILDGIVSADSGEISLQFRLDPDNRPYQVHDPIHGKLGITRWDVLSRDQGRTRIRFIPLTGRTHQLRLHAAHPQGLGCPIVGDSLYGNGADGDKMMLHADHLQFNHPGTGKKITFACPADF